MGGGWGEWGGGGWGEWGGGWGEWGGGGRAHGMWVAEGCGGMRVSEMGGKWDGLPIFHSPISPIFPEFEDLPPSPVPFGKRSAPPSLTAKWTSLPPTDTPRPPRRSGWNTAPKGGGAGRRCPFFQAPPPPPPPPPVFSQGSAGADGLHGTDRGDQKPEKKMKMAFFVESARRWGSVTWSCAPATGGGGGQLQPVLMRPTPQPSLTTWPLAVNQWNGFWLLTG